MSNIAFFSIYAHGHTNPTLEVVRELVSKGHSVRYYSFEEFRDRIEQTGAQFISCDSYMPPAPKDLDKKMSRDFAALIEMTADITVNLDEMLCRQLTEFGTDCVVADSMCLWGKLTAKKMGLPFVCSTTTLAFNKYSAKTMKPTLGQMFDTVKGMPRINAKVKMLQEHGYDVNGYLDLIQNNNDTNTIVYTSREFQPMSETFSDKYAFVGPSVNIHTENLMPDEAVDTIEDETKIVYISLGTLLNKNNAFYKMCIDALRDFDGKIIMSVGENTEIKSLGTLPTNFIVRNRVDQIYVLSKADAFITHCGMNSVNESIYFGVPMLLYPQHSEENAVALRAEETGAGIMLKKPTAASIHSGISKLLSDEHYKECAQQMSETFRIAGGAPKAAEFIENAMGIS